MKALIAAAALALAALAAAQPDSPLAQVGAGAAPGEVLCGEGLVLVMWHSGPACVRPATAERLGLEVVEPPASPAPPADVEHAEPAAGTEPARASSPPDGMTEPAEIKEHVLVPAPDMPPPDSAPARQAAGGELECVFHKCYAAYSASKTYPGLHGQRCWDYRCFVVSEVPPPEEREPLVFFTSFMGEPVRTTIMVDSDRTGYWATGTKEELDDAVLKAAGALGQGISEHTIDYHNSSARLQDDPVLAAIGAGFENGRWQGAGLPVAGDDFDFTAQKYYYRWASSAMGFTANNGLIEHPWHNNKFNYVMIGPQPDPETRMEFASKFMDAMGLENWGVHFYSDLNPVAPSYYLILFNGAVLDETVDLSKAIRTTGPSIDQVVHFIRETRNHPELDKDRMADSVRHVRDNYSLYRDDILQFFGALPTPLIVYSNGQGWIKFQFSPDDMAIEFEEWSDYPIPEPAVPPAEAVERALEFASDHPVLSGPECGLSVADRSVEDRPRYVYLDQVAGTPFWVVDMGACGVRHDLCHAGDVAEREYLVTREEYRAASYAQSDMAGDDWNGGWDYDPGHCRPAWESSTGLRVTSSGTIDTSNMEKAQSVPRHQHMFNRAHEINVDVLVDALDGRTAWFRENAERNSDVVWRTTLFGDENVWFLEDGEVTFATDWPRGYLYETAWLLDGSQ